MRRRSWWDSQGREASAGLGRPRVSADIEVRTPGGSWTAKRARPFPSLRRAPLACGGLVVAALVVLLALSGCTELLDAGSGVLTSQAAEGTAGLPGTITALAQSPASIEGASRAAVVNVLSVTASPTVTVGTALTFSGRLVDARGKPISGAQIGVEDPVLQASRAAATTSTNGGFTYSVPGTANAKAGRFIFRFLAPATNAALVSVTVNPRPALFRQMAYVNNTGKTTYRVDVSADGVGAGSYVIKPGASSLTLWSAMDGIAHNLRLVFTDSSTGKSFSLAPSTWTSASPASIPAITNPYFSNYQYRTQSRLEGPAGAKTESWAFDASAGVGASRTSSVTGSLGVGATAAFTTTTEAGTKVDTLGLGASIGCSTYVGFKASCKISCGVGATLGVCVCLGGCAPAEIVSVGCGVRCCASFAQASCGATIEAVGIQATSGK